MTMFQQTDFHRYAVAYSDLGQAIQEQFDNLRRLGEHCHWQVANVSFDEIQPHSRDDFSIGAMDAIADAYESVREEAEGGNLRSVCAEIAIFAREVIRHLEAESDESHDEDGHYVPRTQRHPASSNLATE